MNKLLLAAVALPLLAAAARAQNPRPRHVSAAHISAASHASRAATPASFNAGHVFYGTPPVVAQPSAASMNFAIATAQSMYSGLTGGSHLSAGRGLWSGGGGRYAFRDGSFWGQRLTAPAGTGSGSSTPQPRDPSVPSVIMPGQLIRTAGLGALVSAPDSSPAPFSVDAGKITYDDSKGYALTTAPGLFVGPKDTPPPPNPDSGGSSSSGGNGITENTNVQFNSHSNNGNGQGTGGGNQ